jgi:hypothetical protein
LTPSRRCIVGRRARWSSSSSVSNTATVCISVRAAIDVSAVAPP